MNASHTAQSKPFQFGLRSLVFVFMFLTVIIGWVADRSHVQRDLDSTQEQLRDLRVRFNDVGEKHKLDLLARLEKGIGKPVSDFPWLQTFATMTFVEPIGSYAREIVKKLNLKGEEFIVYVVGLPGGKVEGELSGFHVYTCDGRVCHVETVSPEW